MARARSRFSADSTRAVANMRKLIEEEREAAKSKLLGAVKEGDIVRGTVTNIADFGAFIDLGGIDGLLHITDMSWGRVNHPTEIVKIGDEVEVKILNIDREREKIALGMKQRTAIARAFAVHPKVLLLDEPFGALDAKVRKELRRWLRRLHDELNVTTIFVTHDQEEALEVADRVVVMNKGHIEQVDSPQAVWNHPASPFVYGFLGDVNLFHGRAHEGEVHLGVVDQTLKIKSPEHANVQDAKASAYIRPHDLQVRRYRQGDAVISLSVYPTTRFASPALQTRR